MSILLSDGRAFERPLVEEALGRLELYDPPKFSVTLKTQSSMWKVSSALQKSVRRGLVTDAIKCVQAMFNGGQAEYVWRRMPVIAMEDVGPGDYQVCATVIAFCRFVEYRKSVDQMKLACWLVQQMCEAVKSRSLTDVTCTVNFRACRSLQTLKFVREASPQEQIALKQNPMESADWKAMVVKQAFVARRLMGDRQWESDTAATKVPPREPGREQFYAAMAGFLTPLEMYCLWAGQKKAVHNLNDAVVPFHHLLPSPETGVRHTTLPEPFRIGGVIEQAFDWHNQEGKRCLAYYAKSYETLADFMRENKVKDPLIVLGMMMFQVESGLLDHMLVTPELDDLLEMNDQNECLQVGLSIEGGYKLKALLSSTEGREQLRLARLRVVEGKESQTKYMYGG